MKYSFAIHGVPSGSQSWGDISDSEYLKSFYNSVSASNVPTQMIVDIRYSGNVVCSYYHYLLLSNVDDFESRPGSYFGMTVCFEGVYCSDFVELYKLLDACFKKVALNTVLIKSGERYKYALSDFDSTNNIAALKRVDGVIRKNIPLFEHNMAAFPENFTPKHREDSWIEKWSIDDVGNRTFVNILLRDSMASISPFYPVSYKKVEILQGDNRTKDNKIKALESDNGNLQSENEGLRTRISDQEKDIETKGATITRQNVVITEHKGTIATLESERIKLGKALKETRHQIEVLKEELKQAQNNRDDETLQKCLSALKTIAHKRAQTDQLIDSISPRLKKAEENIEHIDNQLNKKKAFKLTFHHLLLGGLVIVAIIAIAGIVLPTQSSNKGGFLYDSVTTSDVQGMINESLKPINRTLDDINKKVDNIKDKDNFGSDLYGDNELDYDGDETSYITIGSASDKVFYRSKTYALKALKGKSGQRKNLETGGGQFVVLLSNGNEIPLVSTDGGKTSQLSIGQDYTDSFEIIYRSNGEVIYKRTVNIAD